MARAVARASARRDFIIHYAYIAEKARIENQGLRIWRVRGFENTLSLTGRGVPASR